MKKQVDNQVDTLAAVLVQDERRIDAQRELHGRQRGQHVLDCCVDALASHREEFAECGENEKGSARTGLLRDLVSQLIVEATHDCITSVRYIQRASAQQEMYVHVGTHWQRLEVQVYYDFVKQAARRMELPDRYAENPSFMTKVFEQVAFRVVHHRSSPVPSGEVWINLQNGTLEIHGDGQIHFRDHRRDDFFTYVLPYPYDERAECPRWHRFLDEVLPDASVQNLLAEYIGYCFTRDLKLERMLVAYGSGSNGKSLTLDIIERLVGRDNVSNVSLSALTTDPEQLSLIENKLVNISHESDGKLNTASLKQLVSGEPTTVRVLYEGPHTMYDYAKFFTSFNRLPPSEYTYGYFRRWLLFPFSVTIPEERQDPDLLRKLQAELPGILNWVLQALKGLLQRRAFSQCTVCNEALNEYKRNSNSAMLFLSERCRMDSTTQTTLKRLYDSYIQFCNEEGINNRFGKRAFREIARNYGATESTHENQYYFNLRIVGLAQ